MSAAKAILMGVSALSKSVQQSRESRRGNEEEIGAHLAIGRMPFLSLIPHMQP